jgi:hypothetical protein
MEFGSGQLKRLVTTNALVLTDFQWVTFHLDEKSPCRTSDLEPSWKLPIQVVNDNGRSHQESTRQFALSFHPQETLEAVEGAASYVSPKTATQV